MCKGIRNLEEQVILEMRDVTYCYEGETLPVWKHLSCCFYKGKIHAISGPSGCGKSSILYLLDGLVPHMYEGELDGKLLLKGEEVTDLPPRDRCDRISFVMQMGVFDFSPGAVIVLAGILGGSLVGIWVGPPISRLMNQLGAMINWGTEQQPFLMGIVVSVLMGMILTLPISSAALGVILNLSGLAAGAATIGCCCNMVGFAVASYKENGISGLLAQGIGTSMLQVPNIMRHPLIWLPAIISSAVLGPVGTMLAGMTNNATGSGMGTAGFVGQIMTWQTMTASEDPAMVLVKILLLHFILPGILSLVIADNMRRLGLIKDGHMKLDM